MSTIAVEVIEVPVPGMDREIVKGMVRGRDEFQFEQDFLKFSPDTEEDSVNLLIHDLGDLKLVSRELIDNIIAANFTDDASDDE